VVIQYTYISMFNVAIYVRSAEAFLLLVRDNPVSH